MVDSPLCKFVAEADRQPPSQQGGDAGKNDVVHEVEYPLVALRQASR